MRSINSIKALIVILGLVGGPLAAQETAMPARTDAHGTAYITGGVGDTELAQINQASKAFNLKLILAEKSGSYAADVAVRIVDRKGNTVLEVPSAGPLLLARLPQGSYRVSASYEGRSQEKRVEVRNGQQTSLSYYW